LTDLVLVPPVDRIFFQGLPAPGTQAQNALSLQECQSLPPQLSISGEFPATGRNPAHCAVSAAASPSHLCVAKFPPTTEFDFSVCPPLVSCPIPSVEPKMLAVPRTMGVPSSFLPITLSTRTNHQIPAHCSSSQRQQQNGACTVSLNVPERPSSLSPIHFKSHCLHVISMQACTDKTSIMAAGRRSFNLFDEFE
jgi:hypothetical protein